MKKFIAIFLSLSTLVISGCSSNADKNKDVIEIGYVQSPASLPLFVAQEKGFFENAGLNVQLTLFPDQASLSRAYQDQKIDGRANLTVNAVNEKLSGLDHKIVLLQNFSNGNDVILATEDIKELKDLKDKKIGIGNGILEEFLLEWALISNEMALEDVEIVQAKQEDLAEKIENEEIDALITHEPFTTNLLKNSKLNKIYSTKDSPGLFVNALTFQTDFLEKNEEEMQQFVNAYFQAVNLLEENPQQAFVEGITYLHQNQNTIENSAEEAIFLNLRENNQAFLEESDISIQENLNVIYSFLTGKKASEKAISEMIEADFVENLFFDASADLRN